MALNGPYDFYELELRLKAIISLLHSSERNGLRISKDAQDVIEHECMSIFEHDNVPISRLKFATLLKDTAIRMFRQRRYAEADSRYRMASLFDPRDVTLVSNRATCMYNLKKFERCIDLCKACLMSYPTLCFDNTLLYVKIIVRIGHGSIEVNNYKDARRTYKSLANLRRHLQVKCRIEINEEEFQSMTVPFHRHLEATIEKYEMQNPGKPIPNLSKRRTPYELGLDGYMHENPDVSMDMSAEEYVDEILHYDCESDDEENAGAFNDNTVGTIELAHLCCHVWSEGTGPCQHLFPAEKDDGSNATRRGKRKTRDESDTSLGGVDAEDEEEEEDASGTDEDMPDLLTCDPEDDESETEDDSDSADERDDKRGNRRAVNTERAGTARGKKKKAFADRGKKGSNSRILTAANSSHGGSSSTGKETLADALAKLRSTHSTMADIRQGLKSHQAQKSSTRKQGFKKGFLNASGSKQSKKTVTPEQRPSPTSPTRAESPVNPSPPPARAESPINPSASTTSVVVYETDEEDGPVKDMYSPGTVEDAITGARKVFPLLQDKGGNHLPGLICDVLGEKFGSGFTIDTIDFVKMFGEHHVQIKSGKKKKRGCDKRCGPCFARRMWKMRFTNRVIADVEYFLDHLEEDPRVDQDTFLGEELWQSIGYYGSGHELAFDIPAVVHGVAYIALLQSELRWRGDSITPSMDIQQVFLRALEKNLTTSLKGLNFLFMVLFMIRDTLTLFDVLSDHRSRGLTCSFQFAKTASEIAKSVRQTSNPNSGSMAERDANLMTRLDDCIQNINNWGVLGHTEREEVWVYKFLLRDVTGLLMNFTSRITASPKPSEQAETFTEAFRRLCGDRNDDESQWKHRIVSAMCKQRCRVIERKSASRKAVDLNRSAMLLTRAISARPNQPRLYYKRADVLAYQEKWGDCVRDLQRTRVLLGEQITVKQNADLLNSAQKLLLLHTYTLEGEAYSAQGRVSGRNQRGHIRSGIEFFSKALEMSPKSKRTKASLQKKLRALQSLEEELSKETRTAALGNQDGREPMRHNAAAADDMSNNGGPSTAMTTDSRLARTAHETNTKQPVHGDGGISDSSSDEEASDQIVGNPYAALLGNGASSSSQPSARPSGHPRSCELCDVTFLSEADYTSHMNGKRHKSVLGKARKRGLIPEANGTYSAPGSRLGPTRNEVVEQVCHIISSQGGQAKLSEIMNRLNFRRWKIRDAGSYVDKTFGGMFSVCIEYSHLFKVGAGSSADPILRLRKASPTLSGPTQPNSRDMETAAARRAKANQKVRLSETGDFSQMVTDLLKIENDKQARIKSDEEECGICLDNEPDVRCWPCGHVWCDQCMQLYLKKKGTQKGVECPKCRGTIETLHRLAVD